MCTAGCLSFLLLWYVAVGIFNGGRRANLLVPKRGTYSPFTNRNSGRNCNAYAIYIRQYEGRSAVSDLNALPT